jgi:hypothetical protein
MCSLFLHTACRIFLDPCRYTYFCSLFAPGFYSLYGWWQSLSMCSESQQDVNTILLNSSECSFHERYPILLGYCILFLSLIIYSCWFSSLLALSCSSVLKLKLTFHGSAEPKNKCMICNFIMWFVLTGRGKIYNKKLW